MIILFLIWIKKTYACASGNIILEIAFSILKIWVPPLPNYELWTLAAALGSLACLAAALGPLACLAAALGPLACLAAALGSLA